MPVGTHRFFLILFLSSHITDEQTDRLWRQSACTQSLSEWARR
jgi:hypothetical protein